MQHFNQLTPAEAERIAILMEECGEVIQACGKILRHGYESYNPFDTNKITNRVKLASELGDVAAATVAMHNDIDMKLMSNVAAARPLKIAIFTHHQKDST